MKRVLIVLSALLICGQARAQYYAGFDDQSWMYSHYPNALRIYFDETVSLFSGPIPEIETWSATSGTATPQAWLVLVSPGASAMAGWQCRFRVEGQGSAGAPELLGDGAVNGGAGDDFVVSYAVPRPVSGLHVPLLHIQLTLEPATLPYFDYGLMAFYLTPLSTGTQTVPGYRDGNGTFIATPSLTSPFHGWDVPCMLLNSAESVVGVEPETWGGVKALFR